MDRERLDEAALEANSQALSSWGGSLQSGGGVLLYGCETARGSEGESFINTLAQLTRANVYASIDPTGNERWDQRDSPR